ncbi:lycopene cyclase family protein [Ekhidna sp.]|uniref:lycopene cyclase family protein n=1 Tax=Ekhidna sp. TaxID=2608089 RepID=UPI0032984533
MNLGGSSLAFAGLLIFRAGMDQTKYDYAIVGVGAAGLQLVLKMIKDDFFNEKRILLIDKDKKVANDRTWCFWEKGETIWDELAIQTWQTGLFYNRHETISFELEPYRYKMVRSADFYAYAKAEIAKAKNVDWANDEVLNIDSRQIIGSGGTYSAIHIFDSRISGEFQEKKDRYHSLIQHFKGWFIRTETAAFDPDVFTMMDYRLKWKDSTSFTYVLPISSNTALVEFTLFNDRLLPDTEYDIYLKEYIDSYLQIKNYTIEEVEQGMIPMSDYPFHKHHSKFVTKIGTAGGWVRPSSGYSFKNADRYSTMTVENIKKGKRPEKGIANSRFRSYDSIFLNVLSKRNDLGEDIFTKLYTKPEIQSVFRFLDEESSIFEDFRVMFSLNRPQFWKAFLTTFWR